MKNITMLSKKILVITLVFTTLLTDISNYCTGILASVNKDNNQNATFYYDAKGNTITFEYQENPLLEEALEAYEENGEKTYEEYIKEISRYI
ncbi:MAG: hypothetical protein K2M73_02475, partial [Lachnospiraceae bacterium]|nr:hypothetical protein [Lachnospiraceae bacterium]